MFPYAEQDVNLAWQSCSSLKNLKIKKTILNHIQEKIVLQSGWNGLSLCSILFS